MLIRIGYPNLLHGHKLEELLMSLEGLFQKACYSGAILIMISWKPALICMPEFLKKGLANLRTHQLTT